MTAEASSLARKHTARATFLRAHHAAERGVLVEHGDVALALVDRSLEGGRERIARRHRIDPHAGASPFCGKALGDGDDRCLGRRVGMHRHRAHPGDRGNVDDAAASALRHAPAERDRSHVGAALIDVDDLVPRRHRQLFRGQRLLQHAGAVDQDVDWTGGRLDGAGAFVERLLVADVGNPRSTLDFGGNRVAPRLVAIEHDDRRSRVRQHAAARGADTACPAGHHGNASDASSAHVLTFAKVECLCQRSTSTSSRPRRSPSANRRMTTPRVRP